VNTFRSRRTLKLTSLYLASIATWACGGPASTECAQTATCSAPTSDTGSTPIPTNEPPSSEDAGAAVPLDEASLVTPDAASTTADDASTTQDAASADAAPTEASSPDAHPQGCQSDNDCALGTICASSRCVPGCTDKHGCQGTDACCDGKCLDTKSNVEHCGGCSACAAVSNGSAACTNGACTIASCSSGFVDCDGKVDNGCELAKPNGPSVPTPTRPVAGDYTGSFRADPAVNTLRPTFKWTASTPDTCGGVSYQIQLDDSCTVGDLQSCAFSSPEIDTTVTTTSFQPEKALAVQTTQPVGTRYYWRVRACDGAKVCSSWSPVRYVDVGRVRDDLNGDGYSDLLVRAGFNTLYIYFGGATLNPKPGTTGKPGNFFAFAGDLDGDGYADLAVADPDTIEGGGSYGAILIYPGQASWPAQLGSHETIYHTADGLSGFPSEVASAGDLDGDGRADLMASLASQNTVYVYLGPAGHYPSPSFLSVYGNVHLSPDGFGRAGDLDGDGLTEAAIVSHPTDTSSDVEFLRGAASPSDRPLLRGLDGSIMMTMRPAGDLDGDGFDDVVFAGLAGSAYQSALVTLRGGADFLNTGGTLSMRTFADDNVAFHGLAAGWDTNNDGRSDVYWTAVEGYALLSIPGASNFGPQSPAATIDASSIGSNYGNALAMGDYDGDGKADLAIAATFWTTDNPTKTGTVSVRLAATGQVVDLIAPVRGGLGAALGH
jgi:hypothetical protein